MAHESDAHGIPIVPKRSVNYGAIDPTISRELFVRSALVEGEWEPNTRSSNRTANFCQRSGRVEEQITSS
ncbi:DUF3418 domain-containing protein [Vibrio chagasii]|nr:DUF3418 domain-containing protein [Vibrio chagasii]